MCSLAARCLSTMTHQTLLPAGERNEKWQRDGNNCWLLSPGRFAVDISIFAPCPGHWSEAREITVRIAKSTLTDHFYRPVVEPMLDHLGIVNTKLGCPATNYLNFFQQNWRKINFSFPSNQQLSVWDWTGGNSTLAQVHQPSYAVPLSHHG